MANGCKPGLSVNELQKKADLLKRGFEPFNRHDRWRVGGWNNYARKLGRGVITHTGQPDKIIGRWEVADGPRGGVWIKYSLP
jgi:hypothetical protein